MPTLFIFELDPIGGFCGFPAEIPGLPSAEVMRQELIRRSQIIKELKRQFENLQIHRIFLKTVIFLKNPIVKGFIQQKGKEAFPVFLLDDHIIHSHSFPDFEDIAKKIKHQFWI
ncbi:MAG: arsenic metallochaperone ArsD family protein [Candidatus Helarchaeota archaeon]